MTKKPYAQMEGAKSMAVAKVYTLNVRRLKDEAGGESGGVNKSK